MPSPPTHCIQARAKRNVWGLSSTVARVDRPVVVTAETASKSASVNERPEAIIGNDIARGVTMNMSAVITRPSFICMPDGTLSLPRKIPANARATTTPAYLIPSWYSPKTKDTARVAVVSTASTRQS